MKIYDVVVVGAGQAGAQVAISLRQSGFEGTIAVIGDEPDLPYERPPLSKDYLAGEKESARLLLRPADFWSERSVDMQLGCRAVEVNPDARCVTLEDGSRVGYQHLVWAAGGYPRPLPLEGGQLPGVHAIRTRADVDKLKAELEPATDIVIIGGGYIGLEAAAVLVSTGRNVTVLEAQPRVLARVTAEPVSRFYETEHRAKGVTVVTNASIASLEARDGRVGAVVLGDGSRLKADIVIVGIGLIPHQAVLATAGAECSDGVVVDEFCRTSLPEIFAIGDCAAHPNVYAVADHIRLESVQNAIDQAKVVAGFILGNPEPYRSLPWFWSNQFDLKLQTVGLHGTHDEIVLRGDPAARSFAVIYLRQGRVIALDCINAVKDFMAGKQLVANSVMADRQQLGNVSVPLKSMLLQPAA